MSYLTIFLSTINAKHQFFNSTFSYLPLHLSNAKFLIHSLQITNVPLIVAQGERQEYLTSVIIYQYLYLFAQHDKGQVRGLKY